MENRRTSDKQIVNYCTRQQQKKNVKKGTSSKTGMLEYPDNDAQPFSWPPGHQWHQENSCHQQWPQETECQHCHPAGNMASQCRHTEGEGLHIPLAREEFWWAKRAWSRLCSKEQLLSMVEPGSGSSEQLLNLCLNTTKGPVTLISVYAPTLSATPDAKDEFYENLASTIRNIPSTEQLVFLGDFNARVGADNDSWTSCLGPFGVGKMNENGQRTAWALCLSQPVHH